MGSPLEKCNGIAARCVRRSEAEVHVHLQEQPSSRVIFSPFEAAANRSESISKAFRTVLQGFRTVLMAF